MKEILKKLSEVKKEINPIKKNSTNPFFKSQFFDINELLGVVEPVLQRNALVLLQPIVNNDVFSRIYHIDSGEVIESSISLPDISDPQKLGSAITYFRRYTLQSLLGLQSEDDDGNKSSENSKVVSNDLPWLNIGMKEWDGAVSKKSSISELKKYFKISKANESEYLKEINKYKK